MERKAKPKPIRHQPTYLRAWRSHRGFTQKQFIERLLVLLENVPEAELKVPRTEASLSRIEKGEQPYNQASLEAFARVLDTDPASIIGRDPTKEGKVIDLLKHLSPSDMEQAERVLTAMFEASGTTG